MTLCVWRESSARNSISMPARMPTRCRCSRSRSLLLAPLVARALEDMEEEGATAAAVAPSLVPESSSDAGRSVTIQILTLLSAPPVANRPDAWKSAANTGSCPCQRICSVSSFIARVDGATPLARWSSWGVQRCHPQSTRTHTAAGEIDQGEIERRDKSAGDDRRIEGSTEISVVGLLIKQMQARIAGSFRLRR